MSRQPHNCPVGSPHSSARLRLVALWVCAVALIALTTTTASAQCPAHWLPGESIPGVGGNGNVLGDVVAGGPFTTAGGGASSYFARWTSHPACAPDFDCSGFPNANDIFAFLAAWFAGNPGADYNGVNGLEVQDVLEFINGWFLGC